MKRIPLPDLMKGLAVILMVQVHIMELFARKEVYDSTLGDISLFLGGPFAAPVFMAVMGYFLAASKKSRLALVARGVKLILLGLLLNLGLNFHFLVKIISGALQGNPWGLVFGADILFLAGISIILLSLIREVFKENTALYVLCLLIIPVIPMLIPEGRQFNNAMDYLLAFIYMKTSWSYFPVFPWISYVLLGYVYHNLMEKKDPWLKFLAGRKLFFAAMLLIILLVTSSYPLRIITDLPQYYHHNIWVFIWISGLIVLWMIILEMVIKEWGESKLLKFVEWTGQEVTVMYVVQWLIIGNLATSLYMTQYPLWLVFWFLGVLTISSLVTIGYTRARQFNKPA